MGENKDPLEGLKKQWRIQRREMVTESIGALLYFSIFYGLLLLSFILFFMDKIDAGILLLSLIIWSIGHIIMDLGDSIHTHTRLMLKLISEQNEILKSMKDDPQKGHL